MLDNFKKYLIEFLVFVFFVVIRIPALGHDNFNTDVWKWKARSYDFGTGVYTLNFDKTLQKYHPGVTLMWIGSTGVKLFNFYNDRVYEASTNIIDENSSDFVFGLDFVQKLLLTVVLGISVALIFYVIKKLFGIKYALISIALLTLEPFYLALSRVFHLEGMMTTFMLTSSVWLFYYFQEKKFSRLMISAIFCGLAILTKTSALYLLPFTVLTLFIDSYKQKLSLKACIINTLKIGGKFLLISLLIIFLLWPALWTNAWDVIQALYRGISVIGIERDHDQYYFGVLVQDPGAFYYFVVLGLRMSLIYLIGLIGTVILFKIEKQSLLKYFIFYIGIFALFYFLQVSIPSKKLDRYILPAFSSLAFISAWFYYYLYEKVGPARLKRVKIALFSLLLLLPLIQIHPDYFSFYSPAFGGLKSGIRILEPKWLIGRTEIVSYFDKLAYNTNLQRTYQGESLEELIDTQKAQDFMVVGLPEKYYTQIWPFFREKGMWAIISDLGPFAIHAKYFVYPVWDDPSFNEDRFEIEYVDTIKIRGIDVYNVYKRI